MPPALPMTPPPGWQPAPHRYRPSHRRRVLRGARHRPQHQQLVESQLAVVPVTAGDAELAFDVDRQSAARPRRRARRMPGAWRSSTVERALEELAARRVRARRARRTARTARSRTARACPAARGRGRARSGTVISSAGSGEHSPYLRVIERALDVDEDPARSAARSPACAAASRVNSGSAVERQVQLGRRAAGADVADALREAGLEIARAEQREQRRVGSAFEITVRAAMRLAARELARPRRDRRRA